MDAKFDVNRPDESRMVDIWFAHYMYFYGTWVPENSRHLTPRKDVRRIAEKLYRRRTGIDRRILFRENW